MTTKDKNPCFIDLNKVPKFSQMKGLETTVLTGLNGEAMMMVLNATLPGHTVPVHSHPHEQIGMVYRGKARLKIGDDERNVQEGDFYHIPANVPHSDICIGDEPFVMLDIFFPIRRDFVAKLKKLASEQKQRINTFSIRKATMEDVEAIHRVLDQAFKCLQNRGYSWRAIQAAILPSKEIGARIAQKETHVLVAEKDNRIVATVTGIEEHESLHVCSLAVESQSQRQGIAYALMAEMEKLARSLGCRKLFLQTASAMTEAIELYRELGYIQEGFQMKHFYGEDFLQFGKLIDEE